jgi:hypothetical protein
MCEDPLVCLPAVIHSGRVGMLWSQAIIYGEDGDLQSIGPHPSITLVTATAHGYESPAVNVDEYCFKIFLRRLCYSNKMGNTF